MSRLALLLALLAGAADAQVIRPMGETPGDPGPTNPTLTRDEPPAPPSIAGSPERFSRFSAGRGGPLFAFSQIVDGLVLGAVLGAGLSAQSTAPLAGAQGAYLGALLGAVGFGAFGTALQYVQPIGLVAAGASALGLGVGALAGLGVATLLGSIVPMLSALVPGVLALVGSQVGGLVPLALLWGQADLDPSALALMAAGCLNAFAAAALVNTALARPLQAGALLIAPAVGMAVGGLFAALTRPQLAVVMRYGALPLGVGLALFYLGGAIFQVPQLAAVTALGGMAVTAGVAALVSFATDPGRPAAPTSALRLTPSVALVPPGPAGTTLAFGPAMTALF